MPRTPPDDEIEHPLEDEGFVRGTVKRLFETGTAAPAFAGRFVQEQMAGWKNDFLATFQGELRRFFDRVHPAEEVDKLLAGRRIEFTVSARLVPDDGAPARPARASKAAPAPKKKTKKRRG